MFLATFPMKIYGLTTFDDSIVALYGIPEPGPQKVSSFILGSVGKIISIIIIPLILIIGIIIYSKKSQSSKLRKIITTLLAMAIAVLLCFGVDKIIELYLEL